MKNLLSLLLVLLSLLLMLAACAPGGVTPDSSGTQSAIYTSAAQTLYAQLTLSAGGTAVIQLTQIAERPTVTPAPPTVLPPSPTPAPTGTPPPPTLTPAPCDRAEFIEDVTIGDNTVLYPDSVFTKVWRVRNAGACQWTPAYALVFASGNDLGGSNEVFLPENVNPGDTVDVSVTLTTPAKPGTYSSGWLLRNPSGQYFGVGANAQQPLTIQIQVARPPSQGNGAYDFALSYCDALWRSSTATLGCPGSIDDPNGSVVLLNQPYLESGMAYQPALWTRPNLDNNGRILGQYPIYTVRSGDRFRAELGCLRDSPGCDVTFTLDYRTADGSVYSLGTWREVYDGRTTRLDIDLTSLTGDSLQFLLGVQNRGAAPNPDAFWFAPRIENAEPQSSLVLVWSQKGGSRNACEELRIVQDGSSRAVAQARSCKGAGKNLGKDTLTADEQDQLERWMTQLAPFDAELFSAETSEPLTSYLSFTGIGRGEAHNLQIVALQEFALSVFNRITQ